MPENPIWLFKCNALDCNQSFLTRGEREEHIKEMDHHNNNPYWKCPWSDCHKLIPASSMSYHLKNEHKERRREQLAIAQAAI